MDALPCQRFWFVFGPDYVPAYQSGDPDRSGPHSKRYPVGYRVVKSRVNIRLTAWHLLS